VIWVFGKSEYFCKEGWTGKSLICPSGRSRSSDLTDARICCRALMRLQFSSSASIRLSAISIAGRFESKKYEPQPNQSYLILIVILSETSGGLNG
jgi:hypothetical protein